MNIIRPDGYVDLLNYGGFYAYLWGSFIEGDYKYYIESKVIVVGQSVRKIIPRNATNIEINVAAEVFIGVWAKIFTGTYDKSDEICLISYGLTFAPFCKRVPCTSPGKCF